MKESPLSERIPIGLDPIDQRISYAQNGEDVRLWRAFGSVDVGYYVEVGGWDPEEHSITRSFYGRGWSGLVVEPVASHAEAFRIARPRDQVAQMLAGSRDELLASLHTFEGTGLSTTSDQIAARHAAAGFSGQRETVPMRRLSPLLDEVGVSEIQFMIIDTEGAEADVLAGLDLKRHRPWVLVIEATSPATSNAAFDDWEGGLLGEGYTFAAFDGLNRYYVADEHADLGPSIATPPNVFDRFRTSETARLMRALRDAESTRDTALVTALEREQVLQALLRSSRDQVESLRSHLGRIDETDRNALRALENERDEALTELNSMSGQLNSLRDSRSWRMTEPLRRIFGHG